MKPSVMLCMIAFGSLMIAGCASGLSKQALVSTRSDVFTPLAANAPIAKGESVLAVSASLKTHREFDCPIYNQHTHGTPEYTLVINIDGQALPIAAEVKEENLTDSIVADPEAGLGVRYLFRQRLRLAAGNHTVIVGLPEDDIAVLRNITIEEGTVNSLSIEPVYNPKLGSKRPHQMSESFFEGIKDLSLRLNDKAI